MHKTIEDVEEQHAYAVEMLRWAFDSHEHHNREALIAQAEVVKWRREVEAAERALIVARGENS